MHEYEKEIPSISEMKSLVHHEEVILGFVKNISSQIRTSAQQGICKIPFYPSLTTSVEKFFNYEDELVGIFEREGYKFLPAENTDFHNYIFW